MTCWTCHRLRLTPVETPRLDEFYSEAIQELDDAVPSAQGVPTPTQVIDKYLQAIGGAEKASAITSIAATGKVEAFGSFGGGGNFEYFAQAPDKRRDAQPSAGWIEQPDVRRPRRLVCHPAGGRAQMPR